ncbi:MAG: hypothetical protein RJA22_346 [Verrucomicrobiota bacterium]|jgi:predicted Zn-dependent protease
MSWLARNLRSVAPLALAAALFAAPSVARAHGDFHTLITAADQDVQKEPGKPEPYLRRAELYRLHQMWPECEADIARAVVLVPELPLVDLCLGRLRMDTAWPLTARAHFDRFLAKHPDHVEALTLRSRVWQALGHPLNASEDLARAVRATPEGAPELYIERAQALASAGSGQWETALAVLDDGMRKMGPLVTLQLTAIDIELRRQNYDGALSRVDAVAARSPRKESWLARRGEILLQAGRSDEARQAYQSALAALDTLPPVRRNVPAVLDLERRIRVELDQLKAPGGTAPRPAP